MATFQHLNIVKMTTAEKDAAILCGKFVSTLKFRRHDDYEVCDDSEGLKVASENFIRTFTPWEKVFPIKRATSLRLNFASNQLQSKFAKVQAFRFVEKPATLSTSEKMIVIPTKTTAEPIIIDHSLVIGSYLQITKDVLIQPESLCLVFRGWE